MDVLHMKRMIPDLIVNNKLSGIVHLMVFEKFILKDMFDIIEKNHKRDFWKAMLDNLDTHVNRFSEYNMYFNFVFNFFPHLVKIKNILYDMSATIPTESDNIYLSCQSHLRGNANIGIYLFKVNDDDLPI